MTDRDELAQWLEDHAIELEMAGDGWDDYAPKVQAVRARIEADGKLIAEMRAAMTEAKQLRARIIHTEFQLRAAQAFDRKIDSILARLDAEAQPDAGRVSEGEM